MPLMSTEERALANIELPTDFAEAFQRLANTSTAPETLAECVDSFEQMLAAEGVTVSVEAMYQPEPTRHAVHVDETVEYVPCVLDALIAAISVDSKPVEIRSDPPDDDTTVQLHVTDDEVEVHPSTAVFSIGLATTDIQEPELETFDEMETAVSMASCSYINAFPDPEAYDQWDDHLSDGVVMQLDIDDMVALARNIATGWAFSENKSSF